MSEPMYDFREGILLEKVVYKDDSCNCGYVLLYLLCLLITWAWGSGWFALFFYSYVFHEQVAFIVFIVIWCVFAAFVVAIGIITIQKSKNEKRRKKEEKEERERQMKEIMDAKRKRNLRSKMNNDNNNIFEIKTNIDDGKKQKFENESERINIITSENNLDDNKI